MKRPSKGTVAATLGGVAAAGIAATALIGGPALAEAPTPSPSDSASAPAAPAPAPSGSASADPAKPDRGQVREEKQQELAKALAAELGIDESRVSAALEKVRTQQQEQAKQERSAALKTRLDEAVKEGKLTQAEADAILKASEAGVLGGGGPGLGGGPGGWGHGRPGR